MANSTFNLKTLGLFAFCTLLAMHFSPKSVFALDDSNNLSAVVLFNGRQSELLNTWGGAWGKGNAQSISLQDNNLPTGRRALYVDLGQVNANESRYIQCLSSGFGKSKSYYQTRDLARYGQIKFAIKNSSQTALNGCLKLKDYRDTDDHRASYRFEISANKEWNYFDIPLDFKDEGWTIVGQPDISRILSIDFIFNSTTPITSAKLLLDNLVLIEHGGPIDIENATLPDIVERLARRQWDALWASRNQSHGTIPTNSYQSADAGLNSTAAVLWMLPAATRRHWVEQSEADRHVSKLIDTINQLLDHSKYLPPRYFDIITLQPSLWPEESSVDSAFLALALHQYKSLPSTPKQLREAIDRTENRLDFASFSSPKGWRMSYLYATSSTQAEFMPNAYDGYTNESELISLAAHLNRNHHVPIEKHWSTSANRVRVSLDNQVSAPIVHRMSDFRAPFVQALWNLFVDVRQRGVAAYTDETLAVNPWQNFVCYEKNVLYKLAALGRSNMVQPDAGDDGTLTCYQQFSVYDDFGQKDLFMPWSCSFTLLAGEDDKGNILRFLLRHNLHGTLGLADSAKWATGQPDPYAISARHDFWNVSLSTMALLEWLDGPSRLSKSFADLPEVRSALDRVFLPSTKNSVQNIQPVIGHISP